jgi:hypothetical protein
LSIAAVADQVGGVELPDPGALAPGLQSVLGGVVDPRKRRGVRHGQVVVLTWSCSPRRCARSRPVRDPSSRLLSGLPIYPTSLLDWAHTFLRTTLHVVRKPAGQLQVDLLKHTLNPRSAAGQDLGERSSLC